MRCLAGVLGLAGVLAVACSSTSTNEGTGGAGAAAAGGAGGTGNQAGASVAPTRGGISTVGRTPPAAASVWIEDDGFELSATLCAGSTCVTGSLTP